MRISSRIFQQTRQRTSRKAVYTFIFGDYDLLKEPQVITPGWDYICFTDNPELRSAVWDVRLSLRKRRDRQLDNKRFAMKHMIQFHRYLRDHDVSLSIGGQMTLNCNLDLFMAQYFPASADMMMCCWRNYCVYDDAEECRRRLADDPEVIDAHMQRYRAEGYEPGNGHYISGIIARRHDRANVRAVCDLWWEEYCRGSRRDQLSLSYALWKCPTLNISALDYGEQFFVKRNFISYPHKRHIDFDGAAIKFQLRHPLRAAGADYVGSVDVANCNRIYGWAADRERLDGSIHVSLYDGHEQIATAPAELRRPDVGAYLGDDGLHGYVIPVPARLRDGAPHEISVRFEETDVSVEVSPEF